MALVYGPVAILTVFAAALAIAALLIAWIVRPHDPYPQKQETYECGMSPIGEAWGQFFVRYYLIALVFVIFDVEAIFLFPWATVFKTLSSAGLMGFWPAAEAGIFIVILLIGLAYVWRKGDLEWLR